MRSTLLLLLGLALCATVASAQDMTAFIVNGCSMVPLRSVTESFGASVSYDSSTNGIGISLGYQKVTMNTGSASALVGDRTVVMAAAPMVVSGVTYVPARFVSENLGMTVTWLAETRQVQIVHPESHKTIVLVVVERPDHRGSDHGRTPPGQSGKGDHGRKHGKK